MGIIEKLKNDFSRNEEIKHMIDRGVNFKEIAKKYKVSVGLPDYLNKNFDTVQENLLRKINHYDNVKDLFLDGNTLNEIAEKLNTTKQNISRIIKLCEINSKQGGISKQKRDNLADVKRLHEEGYTLEEISKALNFDEMKVRCYSYELDIDLKTKTELRINERKELIIRLRNEGKTQKYISEKVGITQSYVSKILLDEDLRTRKTRQEYIERDCNIQEDYNGGMSKEDIMDKYNINDLNLMRILKKELTDC